MKKIFTLCFLMALVCVKGWGQCTNTTQYPTTAVAAPSSGNTTTISTFQYQSDYNQITGITSGVSYTSTGSIAGTFITVRSGAYNGTVVAAGVTPLTWTATNTATYYVHYNTNSSCGTAGTGMTTTIKNNGATAAGCTNTTLYPSAFSAPSGGNTITIASDQYQLEYNQMNGVTAGTSFTSSASRSNTFITVRSGSYNGTVVASGITPLIWTAISTTTYFIHYNSSSTCGTASLNTTTTIKNNTLPTCATPSAPTSVSLGTSTISSQAGIITAPATAPTGYMVVASTSSTLSASPVNGTTYAAGTSLGGGIVQYVNTGTAFTASSSLTSNTRYYYFVFSYNSGCAGAPYYSAASATANKYTCMAQPTGLTAGSITTTSASISWTAPAGAITSFDVKYGTTAGSYTTTLSNVTSPVTLTGLSPATTYYYVVVANNSANTSSCGTSTQSAEGLFPTKVVNDDCSSAIALECGGTYTSDNTGALDETLPASTCGSTSSAVYKGVWFKYTATTTGTVTFSTCSGTSWDSYLRVYSGTCAALVCMGSNDDNSGCTANTFSSIVTIDATTGSTYYILLTGYNTSAYGAYTISATCSCATSITTQPTGNTYCQNETATALSVIATGQGTNTYQWYRNTSNSNSGGTLISGATSATYSPSTATVGTFYYYVTVTSACGMVPSSPAAVTINANTAIVTSPTGNTYCQNTTAAAMSVSATGINLTYQWYRNTNNNNNSGTPISGAINSTYTPSTTTEGVVYYYVVVGGNCGNVNSSVATVTVNPATTITQQPTPNDQEICQNSTGATLSVAATGTGTLTYQWFKTTQNNNTSGSSVGAANGGQTSTYTIPTTASGNSYYYVKITSTVCGTITSNVSGRITVSSTVIGAGPATSFTNNLSEYGSCCYFSKQRIRYRHRFYLVFKCYQLQCRRYTCTGWS